MGIGGALGVGGEAAHGLARAGQKGAQRLEGLEAALREGEAAAPAADQLEAQAEGVARAPSSLSEAERNELAALEDRLNRRAKGDTSGPPTTIEDLRRRDELLRAAGGGAPGAAGAAAAGAHVESTPGAPAAPSGPQFSAEAARTGSTTEKAAADMARRTLGGSKRDMEAIAALGKDGEHDFGLWLMESGAIKPGANAEENLDRILVLRQSSADVAAERMGEANARVGTADVLAHFDAAEKELRAQGTPRHNQIADGIAATREAFKQRFGIIEGDFVPPRPPPEQPKPLKATKSPKISREDFLRNLEREDLTPAEIAAAEGPPPPPAKPPRMSRMDLLREMEKADPELAAMERGSRPQRDFIRYKYGERLDDLLDKRNEALAAEHAKAVEAYKAVPKPEPQGLRAYRRGSSEQIALIEQRTGRRFEDLLDEQNARLAAEHRANFEAKVLDQQAAHEQALALWQNEMAQLQAKHEADRLASATIGIKDLNAYRIALDDTIKWRGAKTDDVIQLNDRLRNIRGEINETVMRRFEKAAAEEGNPEKYAQLVEAKKVYRYASLAERALETNVSRLDANNIIGLREGIGLSVGLATGHGLTSAMTAVAGKLAREYGTGYAADALYRLAQAPAGRAEQLARMRAFQQRIDDTIKQGAKSFVTKGKVPPPPAKLPDHKQTIKLAAAFAANPSAITQKLGAQMGAMAEAAPKMAMEVGRVASRAAAYLSATAPTPKGRGMPLLAKDQARAEDNFSPRQLTEYGRRVGGALAPIETVLHGLRTGTLTREAVEAFAHVYPETYAELRTELLKLAQDPKVEVDRQQKQMMSILFGVAVDDGARPEFMRAMQATYASPAAEGQSPAQQGIPGPTPGRSVSISNQYVTQSGQVEGAPPGR
jgi:hypothetical protein